MANPLEHQFTSTGQSPAEGIAGVANVLISGGVGTVQLEKSFDGGSTWHVLSSDSTGTDAAYTTASDVAFNGTINEPEYGVKYRFNCTAYTSGTINVRIGTVVGRQ